MTTQIQSTQLRSQGSSNNTYPSTTHTSTSSLTLVDECGRIFSPPPRTGTDSSTESTSTVASQSTAHSRSHRNLRNNHTTAPQTPSQAAILRAREADRALREREVKMSARQAELLRHKGTFTDSGRHSDDWLFGGWSFKDSVKGAWRWAHKKGDEKGNE